MKYAINVYVAYDEYEYDPDSWITGPDDDFVPAEYNTTSVCDYAHVGVDWDTAMSIADSYAMCPGDVHVHVRPAA